MNKRSDNHILLFISISLLCGAFYFILIKDRKPQMAYDFVEEVVVQDTVIEIFDPISIIKPVKSDSILDIDSVIKPVEILEIKHKVSIVKPFSELDKLSKVPEIEDIKVLDSQIISKDTIIDTIVKKDTTTTLIKKKRKKRFIFF
jgi:hypothetical protein